MIRAFVEKILEMAVPPVITVAERPYSSMQIHPILEPQAKTLQVCTLTAIKDYFDRNPDAIAEADAIVHVEGPEKVSVLDSLSDPFMTRQNFMTAQPHLRKFPFGTYLAGENFIIGLQTFFVQDDVTRQLIKLVGNLSDEKVTQWNDDGVTQKVTAKVAIVRVEEVPVPSPVVLKPFRTFLELDQPASTFIFRIQRREGQAPQCALIEADGGAWELKAIETIAAWLRQNLPKEVTILA
jgi:hypothetical protein